MTGTPDSFFLKLVEILRVYRVGDEGVEKCVFGVVLFALPTEGRLKYYTNHMRVYRTRDELKENLNACILYLLNLTLSLIMLSCHQLAPCEGT